MEMKERETEILEEVAVNEEITEVVDLESEAKKAKVIAIAKKAGQVAGAVTLSIISAVIGYAIGKNSVTTESENIEVDFEVEPNDAE